MPDAASPYSGLHVRHPRLPDEAASHVREQIIAGVLRPGDFLRLDRLAVEMGISITPVREALLLLRAQGYVRQLPRRGFVVAPFTSQDIRDLFWAQSKLAGELAARAAVRVTPEILSRLEAVVLEYERASSAGDDAAVESLGHDFHRNINRAADSMRLAILLDSVVKTMSPRFYATIAGWVDSTRHGHPEIIEALRHHDAEHARTLMELHIAFGADRLIESLEAEGMWASPVR